VISFVIPVRDDAVRLEACLRSIAAGTPPGAAVEVVVADNGSTDDSVRVALAAGARVLVLPRARLGELRNRAAAASQGSILAFVDADHEIAPGWIAAAVEALSQSGIGAAGAPCHPPSPATWVQRSYDRLRRHPVAQEPTEWLGSGNMAVRREAFEQAGGFDTSLDTCEDVDLCRKLRAAGWQLLADERMRNVHHGDPRSLGQVFFGELWRGRDNVRVSLRRPTSGRTIASAVIPVVNLTLAVIAIIGLLSWSRLGVGIASAALLLLLAVVALRTTRMAGVATPGEWIRSFAVAAAYEGGRALAIVGRSAYRRRRAVANA
jgi:GT2 family glycosyltransferase